MSGRIYTTGAFINYPSNIHRPNTNSYLESDPHFWSNPPTWGICRTDYRKVIGKGDYVFWVLPKRANLPQMVWAYMEVVDKIDHDQAYLQYPQKRMCLGQPNGNIIVDATGNYNSLDNGIHFHRFHEIKKYYLVGSTSNCNFLTRQQIINKAPSFLPFLQQLFNAPNKSIFDIIGRKGRSLNTSQVSQLLNYI